jgi:pyrimidine operon attenuation protein/uracil phosphoribosyltransferase
MPLVMDADRMARALTRMSHEILERNRGLDEIALVGIRTRGVPLARRISRSLHEINGDEVPTGALDITLYRDDLMRHSRSTIARSCWSTTCCTPGERSAPRSTP